MADISRRTSDSCMWYTPDHILDRARTVLGGHITFDPTSDAAANQRVRATRFLTAADDARTADWGVTPADCIWMNPPSENGKGKERLLAGDFWARLMHYRGSFGHAVVIAPSIDQLVVTQRNDYPSMGKFPICIPDDRVHFIHGITGEERKSPPRPNAIAYIPGHIDNTELFCNIFEDFGDILLPRRRP